MATRPTKIMELRFHTRLYTDWVTENVPPSQARQVALDALDHMCDQAQAAFELNQMADADADG